MGIYYIELDIMGIYYTELGSTDIHLDFFFNNPISIQGD